jgi:hypothetical protein
MGQFDVVESLLFLQELEQLVQVCLVTLEVKKVGLHLHQNHQKVLSKQVLV